ncbi:spermatogenesis-associated serine-rich protein 2 isoform X2 [Ambystoma mexicanum]|uniref:spermatogenesis-associated serine-rich protein 2 isoform X2 n=1 Tax=Ambystoma mexicanum TaxID=8296 RepID=UPI0037E70954
MSKKQKDSTGFVFDVQSNTVLAQGGSYENMKEKITAVRAVVPNKSNNEIILVLQHFDNSVDRAVQAFMEGSAIDVLKEWKVNSKKKNKKKKSKPSAADAAVSVADPSKPAPGEEELCIISPDECGINGYHVNGLANDTESVDSLSQGLDSLSIDARDLEDFDSVTLDELDGTGELSDRKADLDLKLQDIHLPLHTQTLRALPNDHRNTHKGRTGVISSAQALSSGSLALPDDVALSSASRKLGANIEKSVKDLQRCSVSLARYRTGVKEEMDASIKKMKQTFAELQSCLMDREVALLAEMDKVKAEAMEILKSRQKKAEDLKKLTDVAVRMSEEQLSELRADIKHFVSERKYDEDLGRSARFTCDLEPLKNSINLFGQVSHPKNSYSSRSRCSSVTSATSPSDASTPATPDCVSTSSFTSTTRKTGPSGEGPGAAVHSGTRPNQPSRQGVQGNRRGGQGYRYQGQRPNSSTNPGRPENTNRYRNNSWYPSTPRYQGYPSRPPVASSDRGQTQSTGAHTTITPSDISQPASLSSAPSGLPSPDHRALPQRKPRPTPSEVTSS